MSYVLFICFATNAFSNCLREERVTYPTEEACRIHLAEMRINGMSIAYAFCRPSAN